MSVTPAVVFGLKAFDPVVALMRLAQRPLFFISPRCFRGNIFWQAIRSRWTTANPPEIVAQFFPGLALQNGHVRDSGLAGRISGIVTLLAMPSLVPPAVWSFFFCGRLKRAIEPYLGAK